MRDNKLTKWRKSWKSLKKPWGSRLEWDEMFGREKERAIRREIERNEGQIARGSLNRPSINLNRWRCREVSRLLLRKVSRKWSSTDTGIEEVSRNNPSDARTELDQSTSCREAIDKARAFSIDPLGIEKLLRLWYQQTARYWGGVELVFKSSFSRSEKHRHECSPTYNSTNDPNNL